MLFTEAVADYSVTHKKHINAKFAQNQLLSIIGNGIEVNTSI
jgi:hypothetical protein